MRLAILATLAGIAIGVWLNLRDLLGRSPSSVQAPDPADDVQPADPVTVRLGFGDTLHVHYAPTPGYGTGDFWPQQWVNTCDTDGIGPLTAADRDWLDQTVRASLHPST